MTNRAPSPEPIFDTLDAFESDDTPLPAYIKKADYVVTKDFLIAYKGSLDTFNSYRREVDKFLQWLFLVAQKDLQSVDRADIENFVMFCKKPPDSWIATKMVARFLLQEGNKIVNPEWRPYVVKVSKEARSKNKKPAANRYHLSDNAIRAVLRVLSTYFSFLEMENYVTKNPVKRIRQKNRFVIKQQSKSPVRRLSELQWDYVIETAEKMALETPKHERTLFIMSALYGMYLRISELAVTERWIPLMKHFYEDSDGNWWFKTVGKGNKERDISVSRDMLRALKRYRKWLGLSPLPALNDNEPLLVKYNGAGGLSTRQIRDIVQSCFNETMQQLKDDGMDDDANGLQAVTVHWLRHTGISDDIKRRPKEHVRDDAGHSSSAITDGYIDIDKRDRNESAKSKKLRPIN